MASVSSRNALFSAYASLFSHEKRRVDRGGLAQYETILKTPRRAAVGDRWRDFSGRLRHRTARQRIIDPADQLIDRQLAVTVAVENRAGIEWRIAKCDGNAGDDLVDRHLPITAAIPSARRHDAWNRQSADLVGCGLD